MTSSSFVAAASAVRRGSLSRWVGVPMFVATGLLGACSEDPEDDAPISAPVPTHACDVKAIFDKNGCTGCHAAPNPPAGIDFTLPLADLGQRLLDASSRTTACSGRRIVDSRDPEASVLLSVVDHARRSREGACLLAMPPGAASPAPPADDIECLAQWVRDVTAGRTAEPFEPAPVTAALAKTKLLVHGGPVNEAELSAVRADPRALHGLVDGWTKTPEFTLKLRSLLGTTLQQDAVGTMREGLGFPTNHFTSSEELQRALARSFVDSAVDVVVSGRPFTEVVTTRRRKLTTAELVITLFSDQTSAEIASRTFKVRLVAPARKRGVPATLAFAPDSVWELGGAADVGEECRFNQGKDPIPEVQELSTPRFLALLFGRIQCRGAGGDLKYDPPVTPADHADTRDVVFDTAGGASVSFFDLPAIRALAAGGVVRSRVPRVGFFSSAAFLDNWRTNDDNEYRVTLNQTLNVALGATFSMGDPTPNATSGIDSAHANEGTPCYGCHRLMDPMRPFLGNGMDTTYRAQTAAQEQATFAFFGFTKTGSTADDFARALTEHPRFATAWVLKICSWANSRACSDAEPGVSALAEGFRQSNYDFRKLVVDTLSSPLVTQLSGTPLSVPVEISIARRRHLCGALRARLGPVVDSAGVCDASPTDLGRLVSDDAFARGQPDLVQTAAPGTFHAAGLGRVCGALAPAAVTAHYPSDVAATSASITKLVEGFMGLPPSHPRHAVAIAALSAHVGDVVSAGGTRVEAMQSAFVVACTSPDVGGAGL